MVLLATMTGCTSDKFRVDVNLKGLGNQNVRVVYLDANSSTADVWVRAEKDQFIIEGMCQSPSLLIIYNSMNVPILKTVVSGGDNLEIKGEILSPLEVVIKGSEASEQWSLFMTKNKSKYDMPDGQLLNAEIEKFVKSNPKSIVSTLLLMVDYAPTRDGQIDELLKTIDDSAKPQSLMMSYNTMKLNKKAPITKLNIFTLYDQETEDYEAVNLVGSKPSVLLFWDRDLNENERSNAIEELKMLDNNLVNIIDINIDSDSAGWHKTTENDGTSWKHYWVPGSIMKSDMLKLQVTSIPTVIVTDSTGNQLYRGNNPVIARQTVEQHVK